jgi:putative ABC transport system permease protein
VPASAVLPAFAMVLALGLVSFSGMVRGAVERGEVAASWQEAGADAVISAPAGITAARQRAIAKVPGVSQVLAVSVLDGQLAGSPVSLVLADPAAYAHYLSGTPLAAAPAAFISGRAPGGVVPALASPGLAAELGRAPVTVTAGPGGRPLRVQVAGQAASMSAVAAIGSQDFRGYLVLPRSAVAAAGTPGTLLVLAPGARPGTLAAAARRLLPGAAVVSRPALLAQLESAPLQHGTYLALALGGDAAAVSCLLVLLLSLLMSGASREMTLARMSTMGLSAAQGRRLAMVEALPLVVAVLVGGLASATVLAPLVGPELSLSVFTGSTKSVPVRLEPGWLLATAAGLLVLALLTLAAQAVVASRGTPRSLRIGG